MRTGQYADLEIPHEWLATAEQIRPLRLRVKGRHSEHLARAISLLLENLPERQRTFCWQYHGQNNTLEVVGQRNGNLTRERVRQLLAKSARTETLEAFWLALREVSTAPTLMNTHRLSHESLPQASGDELLRLCLGLHRAAAKRQRQPAWHAQMLVGGVWLLSAQLPPSDRQLRELMRSPARFRTAWQLANALGLSVSETEALLLSEPAMQRTQAGFYGDLRWSRAELMEATAHMLSSADITQWHYSQLGKVAAIFDSKMQNTPPRNLAALMSRSDMHAVFVSAGLSGHWCLQQDSDGHRNNRDAVLAILREAGRPMHLGEIAQLLKRTVAEGSLYALLQRDPEIRSLSQGVFACEEQDFLRPFEEERLFLQDVLSERDFLPAKSVEELATARGLCSVRLATAARVLPDFDYWSRGRSETLYVTAAEAHRRSFARWYHQRRTEQLPDWQMLQSALPQQRPEVIAEVLQLLPQSWRERLDIG